MEITVKNKCCLYVIIPIRLSSITICNLLIDFLSYVLPRSKFEATPFCALGLFISYGSHSHPQCFRWVILTGWSL